MVEARRREKAALSTGSRPGAARLFTRRPELLFFLTIAIFFASGMLLIDHPFLGGNLFKSFVSLPAVLLCLYRAISARQNHARSRWFELSLSFAIWGATQIVFLLHLARHQGPPPFPSFTDFLWLLFAVPIFIVTSRSNDQRIRDWTSILDLLQALFSTCMLYGTLFLFNAHISRTIVHNILNICLLFSCCTRLSIVVSPGDKVFFRNLTLYVFIRTVTWGTLFYIADRGWSLGPFVHLAWSFPVFCFCLLTLMTNWSRPDNEQHVASFVPTQLHAVGTLGLALTSLVAAVVIAVHNAALGIIALSVSIALLAVRTGVRESALERTRIQLRYQSQHDVLTGLVNRSFLIQKLEGRVNCPLTQSFLLFLDLDRFKVINDSLGHDFGDKLLIYVAGVLRNSVGPMDTICRLGGDEFIILVQEQDRSKNAEVTAQRILDTLSSPHQLNGRSIQITGSIGITPIQAGKSAAELLRDADAAMYVAKSKGKNCYHVFDSSIWEKNNRTLELESALRSALESQSFSVAYQPIYSLKEKRLVAFEALARWSHPTRGPIPPEEFIPLAEDIGLIPELSKQVIRTACLQVEEWTRSLGLDLYLGVNISAKQLVGGDFLESIQNILSESKLPVSRLKFEITESVLFENEEHVEEILQQARAFGIGICLDDFGTGYSSLGYLTGFSFDSIKIDRSFVRNLERDQQRYEILKTVVRLGQKLQKIVIVEGVETTAQLKLVLQTNCDLVQGFLFSKPLSAEEALALLVEEAKKDHSSSLTSFCDLLQRRNK